MSFIDWDGDSKITMADDMIDFMVYQDFMREEETEPLFPKRIRPPRTPKPPKTEPASPPKSPKPDGEETDRPAQKSGREHPRLRKFKRIVVRLLVLLTAFICIAFLLGKRQMELAERDLRNDDYVSARSHYKRAGFLIKRLGARDMIRVCDAWILYEDGQYIEAMMKARDVNEYNLLDAGRYTYNRYSSLVLLLSLTFQEMEDYSQGLPYVGMNEDDLDLTSMGESDYFKRSESIWLNGAQTVARAYDYYNKDRQYLFTAWCVDHKVVAIEDHTAAPLDENPHKPKAETPTYTFKNPKPTPMPTTGGWYDPGKMTYDFYGEDPYDASDYSNPDDFYDDHYDDFYDYDEAEEYWIEHEYDD